MKGHDSYNPLHCRHSYQELEHLMSMLSCVGLEDQVCVRVSVSLCVHVSVSVSLSLCAHANICV